MPGGIPCQYLSSVEIPPNAVLQVPLMYMTFSSEESLQMLRLRGLQEEKTL